MCANLVYGSYDVLPRFIRETTFGTIPSSPLFEWISSGVQSLDPTQSKNSMEIYTLDQRRDPRFLLYMEKQYDYPITYFPEDISFLTFGLTSVNTSFAIEEFWNPQAGVAANQRYYRFSGCMVDNVDITWKIGRPIEVHMGILFKGESGTFPDTTTLSGATYGTEPTTAPFLFSDTPLKIDPIASGAQTGSFTSFNVLEASLKIENRRDRPSAYALGQDTVTQFPLGRRHVEFSFTRLFEDQNQVDQFEAGTQGTNFRLLFPLGTVRTITLVNAKLDPLKMPKDTGRDLLVYTYTGKGFQPAAGGNQVTIA